MVLFLLICLVFILASVLVFRKSAVRHPYANGILIAITISALATVCLAQNYTQSLIPEANDGLGVSNAVAYWIIGEDGWSKEKFKAYFENSAYLTFLLILAYPAVLAAEAKRKKS